MRGWEGGREGGKRDDRLFARVVSHLWEEGDFTLWRVYFAVEYYSRNHSYRLSECVIRENSLLQVIQAGMFDQKSTMSERKAFLEAVLEEEANEDEVPYHSNSRR